MENDVTEKMVYRIFFLCRYFVSGLILSLKSKKNLKTFSKNVGFCSPVLEYRTSEVYRVGVRIYCF